MGKPAKKGIRASTGGEARTRDREPVLVMPAPSPVLDERIPGLLLDALAPVEAAIASAAMGVPYSALRTTVVAWRQSELEQHGCQEGIRLAALEFFWERREEIRLAALGQGQGKVSSVPSAPDFL